MASAAFARRSRAVDPGENRARPKIVFVVTEDWYFCSHRLPLARAAIAAGFEAVVVTRVASHGELIGSTGARLIPWSLQRRSRNPLSDLKALWQLLAIYRRERPDVVHHVALKPVLYGSLVAHIAGVPRVVNAMAGLGFVFSSTGFAVRLVRRLVLAALRGLLGGSRRKLILQNGDDRSMLIDAGVVQAEQVCLIRGAGVDTARFAFLPEPQQLPVIVLPARMLWDKGVGEFVEAARMLRQAGVAARFVMVGESDPANPAAIPDALLQRWRDEGAVEWWGRRNDMPEIFAGANIVCLPSYREGLPKALLEAGACGRAIVSTDVPGCREIVRHGVNGLLCQARDAEGLAEALAELIRDEARRRAMGARGREIVLAEFTEERVACETLAVYSELLQMGQA